MRRGALSCGATIAAVLIALLLGGGAPVPVRAAGAAVAGAQEPTAGDVFEPVLGLPAFQVTVLGASPSQDETWAYGTLGDVPAIVDGAAYADQVALLEHTDASGWQVMPLPSRPDGEPLARSYSSLPQSLGPLGGRVTAAGGVVLLTDGGMVLRDPSGHLQVAPNPPATLLGAGASIPPQRAPEGDRTAYAAIEETSGRTGLLIAPFATGGSSSLPGAGIAHYDGESWTREPILAPGGTAVSHFAAQALACGPAPGGEASASSPTNCWLLASYSSGAPGSPSLLGLFRRVASGDPAGYVWEAQQIAGGLLGEGAPLAAGAQMLTVTSQDVWIDFQAKLGSTGTTDVSELVEPSPSQANSASAAGTWCYPTNDSSCPRTLGALLPDSYQSFAWPGGSAGDPGTRIVSALDTGAMLELSPASGGAFAYVPGAVSDSSGASGSSFSSPASGWIGEGEASTGIDAQGQAQLVEVGRQPQGDQLQEMAVPFDRPLLAVAQAPGTAPGDQNAEALAVGTGGEIGRYVPGQGWRAEALYNSAGVAQTQNNLRAVAWPESDRAYAVGDNGTMWLWRAETGLWEPDPAVPYNFIGNLTGIAFAPGNASVGYAVGKQGVLLRYGKSWEQISAGEGSRLEAELKTTLANVNFSSIAFAGGEALVTYRTVVADPARHGEDFDAGGIIVEDGSGWHLDQSSAALLARLPDVADTVLSKVAGLPDGGAVAAGPGLVIERESAGAPWQFSAQPLPEAQNVAALAAYREVGGPVRAAVSIDLDHAHDPALEGLNKTPYAEDVLPPAEPGVPPPHTAPDPLPNSGYLLEQTATGWRDMERMALGSPPLLGGESPHDLQLRPDPVLALVVDAGGDAGLAVGGQTDNPSHTPTPGDPFQTAAAMRFGPGAPASAGDTSATIVTSARAATFAVGGGSVCGYICADSPAAGLGPDVMLSHAIEASDRIALTEPGGLRGFLYTGGRLSPLAATRLAPEDFDRELAHYASLLGQAGSLPVRVAASPTDVEPGAGLAPFISELRGFGPEGGSAYYSFVSEGSSGGPVIVIVLDYSTGALGAAQQAWLEEQLRNARAHGVPAIVMGNAALGFELPRRTSENPLPLQASDAAAVSRILVEGGASAYLFDYPGDDLQTVVGCSGCRETVPAFGSGGLGYSAPAPAEVTDSLVSSGFMLVEVNTASRSVRTNRAPVSARIEPNIGQLALDATNGVLLRRSHAALFEGLARLPASGRAGNDYPGGFVGPRPYEPIPFDCQGPNCSYQVSTDYTFSSSRPDIGQFVAHEPSSADPRQVLLGAKGKPVPDSHSGLFCPYNPGTTVVSITAGGLTYSEPVTVQAGSAEYPCGTVPLENPPPLVEPAERGFSFPEPQSPGAPKVNPTPSLAIPLPPPPSIHLSTPIHRAHHRAHLPAYVFVAAAGGLIQLPPTLLPPAPTAARPTPPSGTSSVQVYQSAAAPERQREEEAAVDMVSNYAGYSRDQAHVAPRYLPLLVLLLAFVGGSVYRVRRRDRQTPEPVWVRQAKR